MKTLEQRIRDFANDPDICMEHLALLKVGHEKGDPPVEIMKRILGSALLRFHRIPINPGQS